MNVYLLQIVNGIGVGMLYFLLAVGLSIVFGLLRFVNFAHGAFYLLGAYLCYQALQWSANFWVALAVVPLVVGAFAWSVESSCCVMCTRSSTNSTSSRRSGRARAAGVRDPRVGRSATTCRRPTR